MTFAAEGGGGGSGHCPTCEGAEGGPRAGPNALGLVLHGGFVGWLGPIQHRCPLHRAADPLSLSPLLAASQRDLTLQGDKEMCCSTPHTMSMDTQVE